MSIRGLRTQISSFPPGLGACKVVYSITVTGTEADSTGTTSQARYCPGKQCIIQGVDYRLYRILLQDLLLSVVARQFCSHLPVTYHRIKSSEELRCYKNIQSFFTVSYEFLPPLQRCRSTSQAFDIRDTGVYMTLGVILELVRPP